MEPQFMVSASGNSQALAPSRVVENMQVVECHLVVYLFYYSICF